MTWTIPATEALKMREHCIDGFPLEACGLFIGKVDEAGVPTGEITSVWPANNVEQSARIYSVDSKDMFEASKFAADQGQDIVGVYHSHTHTQAFPSPTDISKAVDPNWCYAIVSLAEEDIQTNFFLIQDEQAVEIICNSI